MNEIHILSRMGPQSILAISSWSDSGRGCPERWGMTDPGTQGQLGQCSE